MKYILLKDIPHGSKGTRWRSEGEGDGFISLVRELDDREMIWHFPTYNLMHYFKEVKEVTFSVDQAAAIKEQYGHCLPRELDWLDSHTTTDDADIKP